MFKSSRNDDVTSFDLCYITRLIPVPVNLLIFLDRLLSYFWTIHLHTTCILDHPLSYLYTVHFHTSGPSIFILLDRPVWLFCTVHFFYMGPSTSIQLTVHFRSKDRPLSSRTVHFGGAVHLNDHLWLIGTVHFAPHSSFAMNHNLGTWFTPY